MFLHHFPIIKNCFYVCQSVSWLTSLLKLDKYKDISRSELDIFLKFFGDISMMFVHWFHINLNFLYIFQSVSWLTSLLKLEKYRDTSTSCCLSFCQLTYFCTEIIKKQGYLQFWMRYLSEIFWRHFWYVGRPIPNNFEIIVCLSVCWLAHILNEIRQIKGYMLF